VLKTPRTFACSAAAPAKDHCSVLMKGIDRRLHPKILRFSSRFIAGIDSDRRHGRCLQRHKSRGSPASRQRRLVTIIGAYSSTGLSYRIYAPPATRNRADIARAKRAAPSIRAGPSVRPAGVRSDPPANRLDRCRGQARRDLALRRYTPLGILDARCRTCAISLRWFACQGGRWLRWIRKGASRFGVWLGRLHWDIWQPVSLT
jgi:hypothetical protein